MKSKAVFLDKDGTLIPDIPYNVNPELITLENNVVEGLKSLQEAGYKHIVVSNQSGVARGYFTEDRLLAVHEKMKALFVDNGLELYGFYYCPHHPEGITEGYDKDCSCRKPKPGMLLKAAKDLNIDLSQSWMVGDILNDVEAGNRAGCRSVLIDNGNETEWVQGAYRIPTLTCNSINEAARLMLNTNAHELAKL
ncbi:D-glycero-alpha-D-manno-heptose-1,7-bisphosphate 7-phosphatase [Mucilaginibacter litoreus]|uniref:D,D-heptose 1,7-bisphosphate phosphatase n=1 Tax=Mucilaginibacter litoreus TaxID=1048221 RepID=A0ABW3AU47_9SPHI